MTTGAVIQSEMVKRNGCNGYACTKRSTDHESLKLCNIVKETMDFSKSLFDLIPRNDSISTDNDLENIAFAIADVNLVETKMKSSICRRCNYFRQEFIIFYRAVFSPVESACLHPIVQQILD